MKKDKTMDRRLKLERLKAATEEWTALRYPHGMNAPAVWLAGVKGKRAKELADEIVALQEDLT